MKHYENLARIYYDPHHPASFSGADKLYRSVRRDGHFDLSRNKIQKWSEKQESYAVHAEEKTKFRRPCVVVPSVDYQWDADTADMTRYVKDNNGYGYFLLVIDIMSKYIWTKALRNKTSGEMIVAFREILKVERQPSRMRTDKGTEFQNSRMHTFFIQPENKAFCNTKYCKS